MNSVLLQITEQIGEEIDREWQRCCVLVGVPASIDLEHIVDRTDLSTKVKASLIGAFQAKEAGIAFLVVYRSNDSEDYARTQVWSRYERLHKERVWIEKLVV